MKVSECMSRNVRLTSPDETIEQAARTMAEIDAGILPVGQNDRLVGMVTDRDITIRGTARGMAPSTMVQEVMTPEVNYCFEDDNINAVADKMSELKVRRLPVLSRDKRLVGIISLGDIAQDHEDIAGDAIGEISEPGGQHSQTEGRA